MRKVESKDEVTCAVEAIQTLDPATREVFLLRFVEQMSVAEVALAVGEPVGTVKSRLHRGRLRLQEILQSTSNTTMNDANDPLSDEAIEELLEPLRTAKLSRTDVRSANREAVRRALERPAQFAVVATTVTVPMPLAIAASLALMVTAAASLRPALDRGTTDVDGLAHEQKIPSSNPTQRFRGGASLGLTSCRSNRSLEVHETLTPQT